MKHNYFDFIVGSLILILALVFLNLAYIYVSPSDSSSYKISAFFDKADGVSVGSPIKIAGISVGVIEAANLDLKNYLASLDFKIYSKIKIPADSTASIVSDGLLGGKYIEISPGAEDIYLKNGERIMHTESGVNLESLIGKVMFSKSNDK